MSIGQHHSRLGPSARILLVDDNAFGLCARRTILEELGYAVVAKPCPHQALDCFSAGEFDLVITDYRMPGMDGAELISQLRTLRADLPVVLISGFADTLGLSEATTGASAVIQKSAHEVQMMVRAVERLLSRGKAPRKTVGSYRGPASPPRVNAGGA
jgi:CheY-like chemotaxis protein